MQVCMLGMYSATSHVLHKHVLHSCCQCSLRVCTILSRYLNFVYDSEIGFCGTNFCEKVSIVRATPMV